MTDKMNRDSLNNTRKNGKCPSCGKPMDRLGFYCSKCIDNSRLRLNRPDKKIPA